MGELWHWEIFKPVNHGMLWFCILFLFQVEEKPNVNILTVHVIDVIYRF